jgi:hypothetical protein
MNTRTLIVGLLAIATLVGPFASAQSDANAAPVKFGIALEPRTLVLAPNGAATVTVLADAMQDLDLSLSASGAETGVAWSFASPAMHVQAAHRNTATFTVSALAPGNHVLLVRGDDGAGNARQVPLSIRVYAAEQHPAPTPPRPAAAEPRPSATSPPPRANVTWGMAWDPKEMRVEAGHDYDLALIVRSYNDITVSLAMRPVDGARISLANESVFSGGPVHPGKARAHVHVDENATGEIVVIADGTVPGSTERHDARLVLHVARPEAARPAANAATAPATGPTPPSTATPPPTPPHAAPGFWEMLRLYLAERGIHLEGHKVVILVIDDQGNATTLAGGSSA